MTAFGLLLLLGACGKSAQVPLQSWLLDAMEGPTPVSALIHAATMVTAGVYLVVRSNFIFDLAPTPRRPVVVIVATVTLLWGAIIGCAKDDIKKALAGSTMSQIGYMMLGAGLGVAGYAFAIFHLLTHGFFKANMFLGAGSVMHGMNDDVDMRHYGALRKMLPVTFVTFAMGYLAIIGFPGFSGFWSKDKIIEVALTENLVVGLCALLGAGITGVLHDPADADDVLHRGALGARTSTRTSRPKVMTIPLIVLAALSVARRRPAARRLDRRLARAGRRRGGARRAADPGARRSRDHRAPSSRSASPLAVRASAGARCRARPRRTSRSPPGPPGPTSTATRSTTASSSSPGAALVAGLLTFDRAVVDGDVHRRRHHGRRPRHPAPAGPERLRPLLRAVRSSPASCSSSWPSWR